MNTTVPTKNRAWWFYKLRAMLISFSLSVTLLSVLTSVLLYWLYPEWFLFRYDGGWQGLKIVMGVDLVLGPVIAFIIFSPNKPRHLILFDIAIVGTIQLSAFIWGCYALWSQHPLALIYRDDAFNSIRLADLEKQEVTTDVLSPFKNRNPILIYSEIPTGEKESIAETIEMFTKGIPPFTRVENYKPIDTHLDDIFKQDALRKQALEKESPGALLKFSEKHKQDIDELRLALVKMRNHNAVLVMDRNAAIIGAIPVSDNFEVEMATIKAKNNKK